MSNEPQETSPFATGRNSPPAPTGTPKPKRPSRASTTKPFKPTLAQVANVRRARGMRLSDHPTEGEDFDETEAGQDVLQAPTPKLFERLIEVIGTWKNGGNLYEVLGIDYVSHLTWQRRGQAEIDRVAAAPARRHVRASERPFVRYARLCSTMPSAASPLAGHNAGRRGWPLCRAKLNDETASAFLAALSEGASHAAACGRAGIHRRTGERWLEKGETAQLRFEEGEELDEEETMYAVFAARVARVRGDIETEMVGQIRLCAEGLRNDDGEYLTDSKGALLLPPSHQAAHTYLLHRHGKTWRTYDSRADDDSAAVVAAKAGRPLSVTVHHSARALVEGPIEVQGEVVDVPPEGRDAARARLLGMNEVEERDGPAPPRGVPLADIERIEEMGGPPE